MSSNSGIKNRAPQGNNQLRIIGGVWRGRKLRFPDTEGLRPTGDRIRETLFNWLAADTQGAHCLDLFAGSGALGLEAISRGAQETLFIELDTSAVTQLKEHLRVLKSPTGQVIQTSALSWLAQSRPVTQTSVDICFIDPPFALNLWEEAAHLLEAGNWLSENAAIYVESPTAIALSLPSRWQLDRDKKTGQVRYQLYRRL